MDHSKLDPDVCGCRKKELPILIAKWSKRVQARVVKSVTSGKPVNMGTLKHEAKLVQSLARGGPMAFAQENAHYGHFCDECPFRRRTPLDETLTVDPVKRRG